MNAMSLVKPLGVDIFCTGKKFLVYNMVGRNLKVKYRRSVLGVFWTLLAPLSLCAIYFFVFKVIINVKTPNYLAFIVSGILLWNFYSQSVVEGMESLAGNAGLITKIPVPLQAFPYVGMITNLITLSISIPVMIAVSALSGVPLGLSLMALPVYILSVAGVCYGIALILGLGYVFFHDLKHLTGILMQIWFYGTPVIYQAEMIPERFRWIVFANPVGTSFVAIRKILCEGQWPPISYMLIAIGWAVLIQLIAIAVFRATSQSVAEML